MSFVKDIFGGSPSPQSGLSPIEAPPPPPPPLSVASSGVQAAGQAVRQAAASAAGAGFSGTLASGSQGAPSPDTAKQLLSGAA